MRAMNKVDGAIAAWLHLCPERKVTWGRDRTRPCADFRRRGIRGMSRTRGSSGGQTLRFTQDEMCLAKADACGG
jgi:hypothetical protein